MILKLRLGAPFGSGRPELAVQGDSPQSLADDTEANGHPVATLLSGLLLGMVGGYLIATRRDLITALKNKRASRDELDSLSRAELYRRAQAEDLPGRSNMSKDELHEALVTDTQSTGEEQRT